MMLTHRHVVGLVCLASCLRAHDAGAADVSVKGGLTRSNVTSEGSWSAGTGFTVGASVSVPLYKGVRFQPEILFTRKTATATLGDGITEISSTAILDYVEFPFLFICELHARGRITPVVFGGAYMAVSTRAHIRSQVGDTVVDEDVRADVGRVDSGLIAGAGLMMNGRGLSWVVDVRYEHGLSHLSNHLAMSEWRTRSLQLTAGIMWGRRR